MRRLIILVEEMLGRLYSSPFLRLIIRLFKKTFKVFDPMMLIWKVLECRAWVKGSA